jgi:hypothetical protein
MPQDLKQQVSQSIDGSPEGSQTAEGISCGILYHKDHLVDDGS